MYVGGDLLRPPRPPSGGGPGARLHDLVVAGLWERYLGNVCGGAVGHTVIPLLLPLFPDQEAGL